MSYNTTTQQVTWGGYQFQVCRKEGNWNDVPGIYIFCGVINGMWRALYIGQSTSFADRPASHEQWQPALRLGATHVHARVVHAQADRDAMEQELIRRYQPSLNNHHR